MNSGIIASFRTEAALLDAVDRVRHRRFAIADAFTPYPVSDLPAHLGLRRSRIPVFSFFGGVLGATAIIALQAYSTGVAYPIDVGGRPLLSWTAFAIPGFECAILGAALVGFLGMIVGNRLPEYYHPIFDVPGFSFAGEDRFFLLIESAEPDNDVAALRDLLADVEPLAIEKLAS